MKTHFLTKCMVNANSVRNHSCKHTQHPVIFAHFCRCKSHPHKFGITDIRTMEVYDGWNRGDICKEEGERKDVTYEKFSEGLYMFVFWRHWRTWGQNCLVLELRDVFRGLNQVCGWFQLWGEMSGGRDQRRIRQKSFN